MSETTEPGAILCARCGETALGVENPPFPGELGDELRGRTCRSCWSEWLRVEVMVINELQLNFMDPRSLEILARHMREFLLLDNPAASDE